MNLVRATIRLSFYALVLGLVVGALIYGWRGSVAAGVGVVVTALDLWSLGLISTVLVNQTPGPNLIPLCIKFLLMKLPILVAAVVLTVKLGLPAIGCFLGGMALVYCVLVHVAIRGAGKVQQDPFS